MIWRIREALQVLSADRVRESLNCIGLYTNLGGVDVRAGNANHIQGGRTFMRTTISSLQPVSVRSLKRAAAD
jgi:hypothetical protein